MMHWKMQEARTPSPPPGTTQQPDMPRQQAGTLQGEYTSQAPAGTVLTERHYLSSESCFC